ncbi:PREDICTED: hippocampus abundant transcript-like protein 1 [Priapulus caudatus]|uniref:Hippocampus abundant transcript-like protein 1 n=1 Tax=Priapulus caudatus TaxID=37621 RepID=A0ABM1F2V7_PRICU|nr:PREDICTED: hippocampus abundant transcript-like protein 1 [Priapulus caudatus]
MGFLKRKMIPKPKLKLPSPVIGKATVYHALVVIFLEFFAWGLLTSPMITVLKETFPHKTFLMNGLIQGIKGLLSFLSAPLIGALSDMWGRKSFLLLTVFFTCAPIPLMRISPWWFFAIISISGVFSVTFSIVFAYVADITDNDERSSAYGLVIGFSPEAVASFIAVVGILSVIAQTGVLTFLMRTLGAKHTIMVGLTFQMLQLAWYGFGSQTWMMWAAGMLASVASISYPAISAFVSMHADADKQGVVQGIITGLRGLCNGLGPGLYGCIFYLFDVNLSDMIELDTEDAAAGTTTRATTSPGYMPMQQRLLPGPPFVFGAVLVILALLVTAFIPDAAPPTLHAAKLHHRQQRALVADCEKLDEKPLLNEEPA